MGQHHLSDLTPEQQERLEAAEQHALKLLNRKMREDRWYPRRHQFVAIVCIGGLFVVIAIVMLLGTVFNW